MIGLQRKIKQNQRTVRSGLWLGSSEERPAESEGKHAMYVWVTRFSGRAQSKGKGSEARACLAGLRDSKELSVAGEEWKEEEWWEPREAECICWGLDLEEPREGGTNDAGPCR